MEIVFKETKDGERQLELWDADGKVCTMTDVADLRKIEAITDIVNYFENAANEIEIIRRRAIAKGRAKERRAAQWVD